MNGWTQHGKVHTQCSGEAVEQPPVHPPRTHTHTHLVERSYGGNVLLLLFLQGEDDLRLALLRARRDVALHLQSLDSLPAPVCLRLRRRPPRALLGHRRRELALPHRQSCHFTAQSRKRRRVRRCRPFQAGNRGGLLLGALGQRSVAVAQLVQLLGQLGLAVHAGLNFGVQNVVFPLQRLVLRLERFEPLLQRANRLRRPLLRLGVLPLRCSRLRAL